MSYPYTRPIIALLAVAVAAWLWLRRLIAPGRCPPECAIGQVAPPEHRAASMPAPCSPIEVVLWDPARRAHEGRLLATGAHLVQVRIVDCGAAPQPGTPMRLRFRASRVRYDLETWVDTATVVDGAVVILAPLTEWVHKSEDRGATRRPIDAETVLSVQETDGAQPSIRPCRIVDWSPTGVSVTCDAPAPCGAHVLLRVPVSEEMRVAASALVVRCDSDTGRRRQYRIGCAFTDLDRQTANRIQQYCDSIRSPGGRRKRDPAGKTER